MKATNSSYCLAITFDSKFRIGRNELMTSSWEENPSERTQFTDIARKLESSLGEVYEVGFFFFLLSFATLNCFLTY